MYYRNHRSGFSLVEILVVAGLTTLVFGALLLAFTSTFKLTADSRAKLAALSLANERLEYFRSLPYDDVGTLAGIPAGVIPQNSTSTLNEIVFHERVLVEYVDDAADGTGASDSNGIISDYKRVKVEYSWNFDNATSSISLISNIVPRSIETTAGGGTIRVNVLDADSTLLPGASVRLINDSLSPSIDVTRITDSTGVALFSGAPAGGGYELIVTANIGGHPYSTSQTYEVEVANPNPILAPFAVLEADISTLTLQIGRLSDLLIGVYSSITEGVSLTVFDDLTGALLATDVTTSGGNLVLENTAGVYDASGVAYYEVVPTTLSEWGTIRVGAQLPSNTSYVVRLYTGSGVGPYTIIPDTEITANSTGFSGPLIDISELDPLGYPAIIVGISLATTDTSQTPQIDEVGVYYREGQTALATLSAGIHGEKVVGTMADGSEIYKYEDTFLTDGDGEYQITDLEFDTYNFSFPGAYTIAEACPAHPYVHQAGIDGVAKFLLTAATTYSVRVTVQDASGRTIPGAEVEVQRSGFSATENSSLCGQAFFSSGLGSFDDYIITVRASGYNTETRTSFVVDDNESVTIALTES